MQFTTSWQDLMHPGEATDFFTLRQFFPFVPELTEYSRVNALWLAELSRVVYRHDIEENNPPPQPTRTHFLGKAGFNQIGFFYARETNTQALLLESTATPAYAVLVFRGTEQHAQDFKTDLGVGSFPMEKEEISVHDGFRAALDSVWSKIEAALAKLDCPIFYTGHSLGAALATLAAARRAPHAVYTFGSPRVGNAAFVATLDHVPNHRVVDDLDAITSVPPESLGFRHAGIEQKLLEPKAGSIFAWIKHLYAPPKPLADHAPINYVRRI